VLGCYSCWWTVVFWWGIDWAQLICHSWKCWSEGIMVRWEIGLAARKQVTKSLWLQNMPQNSVHFLRTLYRSRPPKTDVVPQHEKKHGESSAVWGTGSHCLSFGTNIFLPYSFCSIPSACIGLDIFMSGVFSLHIFPILFRSRKRWTATMSFGILFLWCFCAKSFSHVRSVTWAIGFQYWYVHGIMTNMYWYFFWNERASVEWLRVFFVRTM